MNTIPSFPKLRRIFLTIGFFGACFILGLVKRFFL